MKKTSLKYYYKYPVITGVIGFLFTLGLTQYLTYKDYLLYQSSEQQNVIDQKNLLEKKIVYGLRYGFSAIKTLAYLEENFGITSQFEKVAQEILETNQYIDAIQLLEGGEIRYIYPLEGNESVLGYNILEDPLRNKEAIKAMELGSIFFAGPFDLKQGGMGIVGRQPIFKDNNFWGFAAIVIKLETFYKMIDYKSFENSDYFVQFSKTNPDTGILENFLPESYIEYTGYESSATLPLGNWKLTVQLKESNAWINVLPAMILRIAFSIVIGILVWYLAMIPAILEAKVARQSRKIKKSNERFEYATMATSDAIWDWDIQNNRVFRSENFEKMFGYKKNGHLDNTDFWDSIIHPEDLVRVKQNLEQVLTGSDTFWKQEFQIKKSNGGYIHVMDKGIVLRNESGIAVRLIGATQDISEIKANEKALFKMSQELLKRAKELELSNSELEQFAYVASHDLQEPLRMITGFLKLLERKYNPLLDEKGKQYIQFSISGAERMRHIILDLLEYSRADNIGQKETVNLNDLIKEIKLLEKKLIHERNAEVIFEELPEITAAKAPMRQLFQNIIENSLKYSNQQTPPEIIVQAEDIGAYWRFCIQDNGIGIAKDYHEKVFQVFQRLHSKEEIEGTGIGLAICKKIVENHGGEIWIDSELGQGTAVYFTLKKEIG